jgi:hypothetical protein
MLLLALACAGPSAGDPAEITVEALDVEVDGDIPTLLHVRWTAADASPAKVRWTVDGEGGETSLDSGGPDHVHDLFGIPAGETAVLELVHIGEDGSEGVASGGDVTLARAPSWLPEVTIDQPPQSPPTPYLFVSSESAQTMDSAWQVVDWKGRPIWWRPQAELAGPFGQPSIDGQGTYFAGTDTDRQEQALVHLTWEGTRTLFGAPGAHHEAHERPDGDIGVCRTQAREIAGERVAIDVLAVVRPDGTSRDVWDAEHWYDPTLPTRCEGLTVGNGEVDGTHCNGVAWDDVRGEWIVSLYCRGAVVAIGEDGEERWSIAGEDGTVGLSDDAQFSLVHSPRVIDGKLWLFDNGSSSAPARAMSLDIDPAGGFATLGKSFEAPDGSYTPVLGSVQPYGDGVIAGFGLGGDGWWFGPDGEPRAHLSLESPHMLSAVGGVGTLGG